MIIERSAPARERTRILVADHQAIHPVALHAIERALQHGDHTFAERVHLAVELEHGDALPDVEQRRVIRCSRT